MATDATARRSVNRQRHIVFEQLNPWVMFTYYVVVIACAMIFVQPIFLAVILLLIIAVDLLGKGGHQVLTLLEGGLFMVAFIMVLNPLLNNRGAHVIWSFGGLLITVESILYGFLMALSLMCVLLIFVSYNQYFTSQKLMYIFARFSPKLTLLTMITLRFVPLFLRRFRGITQAQAVRGIEVKQGNFRQRSLGVTKLLEVLLVSSFNHALQTADSMSARGYASSKRSSYQRYKFTSRDGLALGWLVILSGICFYAASRGVGRMVIYPSVGSFGLNQQGWLVLLGVILIISFPLILEGWEWLWWHLLRR